MKIDIIYLDMDGVLVDFFSAAMRAINLDPEEALKKHPPGEYIKFHKLVGTDEEGFWEAINTYKPERGNWPEAAYLWFAECKAYPWAERLWTLCEGLAQTWVMTSPSRAAGSAFGKIMWLQKWRGYDFRNYVIAPRKYLLARPGALLIDDDPKNVRKWRDRGGKAFLFPRIWNARHEKSDDAFNTIVNELTALFLEN